MKATPERSIEKPVGRLPSARGSSPMSWPVRAGARAGASQGRALDPTAAEVQESILEAAVDGATGDPSATLDAIERILPALRTGAARAACAGLKAASRALHQLGRSNDALAYSQEAIDRLDDSCTARFVAGLRNIHGGNLMQLGRYAEALDVLDRAAFDARECEEPDMLGLVLVNLGGVVAMMGDHTSAVDLFLEARRLISKDRVTSTRVIAQSNIAATWLQAAVEADTGGDMTARAQHARAAVDAAKIAIDESRAANDIRNRISTLHTLVRAWVLLGAAGSAQAEFDRLVAQLPEPYLQDASLRTTRAQLLLAGGDHDAARAVLASMTEEADITSSPELHAHVLAMLVLAHEQAGRYRDALQSQKQLTALVLKGSRKVAEEHSRRFRQVDFMRSDDAVAFLAHDVRAPLGSIIAMATESLPSADCSARMAALARRALSLTDKFLAMARLERVQTQSFEPVELGGLLDDICESLHPLAQQGGKRLVSSLRFGGYVSGHRESLQRAATNLIENALQATRDGGTVSVGIEVMESGNASVVIRDQGCGMPEGHQAMLKGRSEVGSSSAGGRFGLAIVARVARMHGIRIRVNAASTGTEIALDFAAQAKPPATDLRRASPGPDPVARRD